MYPSRERKQFWKPTSMELPRGLGLRSEDTGSSSTSVLGSSGSISGRNTQAEDYHGLSYPAEALRFSRPMPKAFKATITTKKTYNQLPPQEPVKRRETWRPKEQEAVIPKRRSPHPPHRRSPHRPKTPPQAPRTSSSSPSTSSSSDSLDSSDEECEPIPQRDTAFRPVKKDAAVRPSVANGKKKRKDRLEDDLAEMFAERDTSQLATQQRRHSKKTSSSAVPTVELMGQQLLQELMEWNRAASGKTGSSKQTASALAGDVTAAKNAKLPKGKRHVPATEDKNLKRVKREFVSDDEDEAAPRHRHHLTTARKQTHGRDGSRNRVRKQVRGEISIGDSVEMTKYASARQGDNQKLRVVLPDETRGKEVERLLLGNKGKNALDFDKALLEQMLNPPQLRLQASQSSSDAATQTKHSAIRKKRKKKRMGDSKVSVDMDVHLPLEGGKPGTTVFDINARRAAPQWNPEPNYQSVNNQGQHKSFVTGLARTSSSRTAKETLYCSENSTQEVEAGLAKSSSVCVGLAPTIVDSIQIAFVPARVIAVEIVQQSLAEWQQEEERLINLQKMRQQRNELRAESLLDNTADEKGYMQHEDMPRWPFEEPTQQNLVEEPQIMNPEAIKTEQICLTEDQLAEINRILISGDADKPAPTPLPLTGDNIHISLSQLEEMQRMLVSGDAGKMEIAESAMTAEQGFLVTVPTPRTVKEDEIRISSDQLAEMNRRVVYGDAGSNSAPAKVITKEDAESTLKLKSNDTALRMPEFPYIVQIAHLAELHGIDASRFSMPPLPHVEGLSTQTPIPSFAVKITDDEHKHQENTVTVNEPLIEEGPVIVDLTHSVEKPTSCIQKEEIKAELSSNVTEKSAAPSTTSFGNKDSPDIIRARHLSKISAPSTTSSSSKEIFDPLKAKHLSKLHQSSTTSSSSKENAEKPVTKNVSKLLTFNPSQTLLTGKLSASDIAVIEGMANKDVLNLQNRDLEVGLVPKDSYQDAISNLSFSPSLAFVTDDPSSVTLVSSFTDMSCKQSMTSDIPTSKEEVCRHKWKKPTNHTAFATDKYLSVPTIVKEQTTKKKRSATSLMPCRKTGQTNASVSSVEPTTEDVSSVAEKEIECLTHPISTPTHFPTDSNSPLQGMTQNIFTDSTKGSSVSAGPAVLMKSLRSPPADKTYRTSREEKDSKRNPTVGHHRGIKLERNILFPPQKAHKSKRLELKLRRTSDYVPKPSCLVGQDAQNSVSLDQNPVESTDAEEYPSLLTESSQPSVESSSPMESAEIAWQKNISEDVKEKGGSLVNRPILKFPEKDGSLEKRTILKLPEKGGTLVKRTTLKFPEEGSALEKRSIPELPEAERLIPELPEAEEGGALQKQAIPELPEAERLIPELPEAEDGGALEKQAIPELPEAEQSITEFPETQRSISKFPEAEFNHALKVHKQSFEDVPLERKEATLLQNPKNNERTSVANLPDVTDRTTDAEPTLPQHGFLKKEPVFPAKTLLLCEESLVAKSDSAVGGSKTTSKAAKLLLSKMGHSLCAVKEADSLPESLPETEIKTSMSMTTTTKPTGNEEVDSVDSLSTLYAATLEKLKTLIAERTGASTSNICIEAKTTPQGTLEKVESSSEVPCLPAFPTLIIKVSTPVASNENVVTTGPVDSSSSFAPLVPSSLGGNLSLSKIASPVQEEVLSEVSSTLASDTDALSEDVKTQLSFAPLVPTSLGGNISLSTFATTDASEVASSGLSSPQSLAVTLNTSNKETTLASDSAPKPSISPLPVIKTTNYYSSSTTAPTEAPSDVSNISAFTPAASRHSFLTNFSNEGLKTLSGMSNNYMSSTEGMAYNLLTTPDLARTSSTSAPYAFSNINDQQVSISTMDTMADIQSIPSFAPLVPCELGGNISFSKMVTSESSKTKIRSEEGSTPGTGATDMERTTRVSSGGGIRPSEVSTLDVPLCTHTLKKAAGASMLPFTPVPSVMARIPMPREANHSSSPSVHTDAKSVAAGGFAGVSKRLSNCMPETPTDFVCHCPVQDVSTPHYIPSGNILTVSNRNSSFAPLVPCNLGGNISISTFDTNVKQLLSPDNIITITDVLDEMGKNSCCEGGIEVPNADQDVTLDDKGHEQKQDTRSMEQITIFNPSCATPSTIETDSESDVEIKLSPTAPSLPLGNVATLECKDGRSLPKENEAPLSDVEFSENEAQFNSRVHDEKKLSNELLEQKKLEKSHDSLKEMESRLRSLAAYRALAQGKGVGLDFGRFGSNSLGYKQVLSVENVDIDDSQPSDVSVICSVTSECNENNCHKLIVHHSVADIGPKHSSENQSVLPGDNLVCKDGEETMTLELYDRFATLQKVLNQDLTPEDDETGQAETASGTRGDEEQATTTNEFMNTEAGVITPTKLDNDDSFSIPSIDFSTLNTGCTDINLQITLPHVGQSIEGSCDTKPVYTQSCESPDIFCHGNICDFDGDNDFAPVGKVGDSSMENDLAHVNNICDSDGHSDFAPIINTGDLDENNDFVPVNNIGDSDGEKDFAPVKFEMNEDEIRSTGQSTVTDCFPEICMMNDEDNLLVKYNTGEEFSKSEPENTEEEFPVEITGRNEEVNPINSVILTIEHGNVEQTAVNLDILPNNLLALCQENAIHAAAKKAWKVSDSALPNLLENPKLGQGRLGMCQSESQLSGVPETIPLSNNADVSDMTILKQIEEAETTSSIDMEAETSTESISKYITQPIGHISKKDNEKFDQSKRNVESNSLNRISFDEVESRNMYDSDAWSSSDTIQVVKLNKDYVQNTSESQKHSLNTETKKLVENNAKIIANTWPNAGVQAYSQFGELSTPENVAITNTNEHDKPKSAEDELASIGSQNSCDRFELNKDDMILDSIPTEYSKCQALFHECDASFIQQHALIREALEHAVPLKSQLKSRSSSVCDDDGNIETDELSSLQSTADSCQTFPLHCNSKVDECIGDPNDDQSLMEETNFTPIQIQKYLSESFDHDVKSLDVYNDVEKSCATKMEYATICYPADELKWNDVAVNNEKMEKAMVSPHADVESEIRGTFNNYGHTFDDDERSSETSPQFSMESMDDNTLETIEEADEKISDTSSQKSFASEIKSPAPLAGLDANQRNAGLYPNGNAQNGLQILSLIKEETESSDNESRISVHSTSKSVCHSSRILALNDVISDDEEDDPFMSKSSWKCASPDKDCEMARNKSSCCGPVLDTSTDLILSESDEEIFNFDESIQECPKSSPGACKLQPKSVSPVSLTHSLNRKIEISSLASESESLSSTRDHSKCCENDNKCEIISPMPVMTTQPTSESTEQQATVPKKKESGTEQGKSQTSSDTQSYCSVKSTTKSLCEVSHDGDSITSEVIPSDGEVEVEYSVQKATPPPVTVRKEQVPSTEARDEDLSITSELINSDAEITSSTIVTMPKSPKPIVHKKDSGKSTVFTSEPDHSDSDSVAKSRTPTPGNLSDHQRESPSTLSHQQNEKAVSPPPSDADSCSSMQSSKMSTRRFPHEMTSIKSDPRASEPESESINRERKQRSSSPGTSSQIETPGKTSSPLPSEAESLSSQRSVKKYLLSELQDVSNPKYGVLDGDCQKINTPAPVMKSTDNVKRGVSPAMAIAQSAVGMRQTPSPNPSDAQSAVGMRQTPSPKPSDAQSAVGMRQTPSPKTSDAQSAVGMRQTPSPKPSDAQSAVGMRQTPSPKTSDAQSAVGMRQTPSPKTSDAQSAVGMRQTPSPKTSDAQSAVGMRQTPTPKPSDAQSAVGMRQTPSPKPSDAQSAVGMRQTPSPKTSDAQSAVGMKQTTPKPSDAQSAVGMRQTPSPKTSDAQSAVGMRQTPSPKTSDAQSAVGMRQTPTPKPSDAQSAVGMRQTPSPKTSDAQSAVGMRQTTPKPSDAQSAVGMRQTPSPKTSDAQSAVGMRQTTPKPSDAQSAVGMRQTPSPKTSDAESRTSRKCNVKSAHGTASPVSIASTACSSESESVSIVYDSLQARLKSTPSPYKSERLSSVSPKSTSVCSPANVPAPMTPPIKNSTNSVSPKCITPSSPVSSAAESGVTSDGAKGTVKLPDNESYVSPHSLQACAVSPNSAEHAFNNVLHISMPSLQQHSPADEGDHARGFQPISPKLILRDECLSNKNNPNTEALVAVKTLPRVDLLTRYLASVKNAGACDGCNEDNASEAFRPYLPLPAYPNDEQDNQDGRF